MTAADPRLAELTEALHAEYEARSGCYHELDYRGCEYEAVEIMKVIPDGWTLTRTATTEAVALAAAYDALGGMYSWNDAYLDSPENAHLWTSIAGRILRHIVGRPARQPEPDAIAAALAATGGSG